MTAIDPAALEALRAWDTPTICNALEVVVPHRRATGFTVEHLHCLDPALKPIVGYARTATIRAVESSPLRPDAVAKIPVAVDLLTRREGVILGAARSGGFDIDALKRAMADSAEIH